MCNYCEKGKEIIEINGEMKATITKSIASDRWFMNISKPKGKTKYMFEIATCPKCGDELYKI